MAYCLFCRLDKIKILESLGPEPVWCCSFNKLRFLGSVVSGCGWGSLQLCWSLGTSWLHVHLILDDQWYVPKVLLRRWLLIYLLENCKLGKRFGCFRCCIRRNPYEHYIFGDFAEGYKWGDKVDNFQLQLSIIFCTILGKFWCFRVVPCWSDFKAITYIGNDSKGIMMNLGS